MKASEYFVMADLAAKAHAAAAADLRASGHEAEAAREDALARAWAQATILHAKARELEFYGIIRFRG
ncbi:MAG: hypothetical protein BroJett013_30390 [Alphaproteobacteria bacterium]|nr:MAG: hypothetical protein BroJett013_30390 [Alphaproteobacteria bacterium]